MKIFVCIKPVPDTESRIKILDNHTDIDKTNIKWVMNPYDEIAVEEAIRLRDTSPGSTAWVISLGPKPRTNEVIRTALAMGIDEAIMIECNQDLDSEITAKSIASFIEKEGPFEYIFTGKVSVDDNLSCIGPMIAEILHIPYVTAISKLQHQIEWATVERDNDGGTRDTVQIKLPALLTVNKNLNVPRYVNLPGIMKAKKKIIREIKLDESGNIKNKKISFDDFRPRTTRTAVQLITGEPTTQVNELLRILHEDAKVI